MGGMWFFFRGGGVGEKRVEEGFFFFEERWKSIVVLEFLIWNTIVCDVQ